MLDLGGGEMLLIAIVALVVIGPKELPALFRTVGQFTGKARSMAREFTSAMNAAADQSGMTDLNKTLKGVTRPVSYAADRLRETTGLATASLNSVKQANIKPGGATEKLAEKLSADREATRLKIAEASAKAAADRKAAAEPTPEELAEVEVTAPKAPRKPRAKPAETAARKPRVKAPIGDTQ